MVATNFFAGAAVLLAAARQVSAGSAIIHNQCPYPVYLWSISNSEAPMQTIAANGGQYSEQYRVNPNGGGVSIKMGSDTTRRNVTQFEYTYTPKDGSLWYDLSNIDGYPFQKYGVTVVSTDKGCREVICPAGQSLCAQAYNIPTDNFATAECGASADAVVVLCSGDRDTSGSNSVSSVASQAASTAVPVSSSIFTAPATSTKAAAPATSSASKPAHSTHATQPVAQNIAATTAPATTAAPVIPQQAEDPYVVVLTTFVTHVVTVEARSPQPTAAKRDVHHEHAAVHAEHAARRHAHPRAFPRK